MPTNRVEFQVLEKTVRILRRNTMSKSLIVRVAGVALIACVGLSTTACKKKNVEDQAPTQQVQQQAKPRSVVLYQYGFHPNTLTIPAGTTVTFQNRDPERHNINIAALNIDQNVDPSGEWSYTFSTKGEFAVTNRFSQAMKFTLVVE
jgi:plastocyanin